jgi:hypothetical protein
MLSCPRPLWFFILVIFVLIRRFANYIFSLVTVFFGSGVFPGVLVLCRPFTSKGENNVSMVAMVITQIKEFRPAALASLNKTTSRRSCIDGNYGILANPGS